MKAGIFASVFVLLLIMELTAAVKVQYPAWAIRQLRRRTDEGCDRYQNNRCQHGRCVLNPTVKSEDTPENFANDKYNLNFFCACYTNYETYYVNEDGTPKNTPESAEKWCNSPVNLCRTEKGKKNPCQDKSELNTCTCTGPGQYQCHCTKFWKGPLCREDVDECAKCKVGDGSGCPCMNGGTCRNRLHSDLTPLGFKCSCEQGTTGDYCEKIIAACLREPCKTKAKFGGALDTDACIPVTELEIAKPETLKGYKCECIDDNWGGLDCELRKGECKDTGTDANCLGHCVTKRRPTKANGVEDYFRCICRPGMENNEDDVQKGKFCTKITDLCKNSPCLNNGDCLMLGPNDKLCVCPAGFSGKNCESDLNSCSSTALRLNRPKCLNNGKCVGKTKSGTQYGCECENKGKPTVANTGQVCEKPENECAKEPCGVSNGNGKCIDTLDSFLCKCKSGYKDKTCLGVQSLCDTNPNICLYGGKCEPKDDITENFACTCDGLKFGDNNAFDKDTDFQCLVPGPELYRHSFEPLNQLNMKPRDSAVYRTRDGGLYNDPYLQFDLGAVEQTFVGKGGNLGTDSWMLLFFKTPAPTMANLVTIVDKAKKTLFEIVAGEDGTNFILKFHHMVPSKSIALPQHSLKSWNSIWWGQSNGKIAVRLNGKVIPAPEAIDNLPLYNEDMVNNKIVLGSKYDKDNEVSGPFFSGGIGDLLYGKYEGGPTEIKLKDLFKAHARDCDEYLDLRFESPDLYRDVGCYRFDPIALKEKVFSTKVGGVQLASFRPHNYASEAMAKLETVSDDANILVPNFRELIPGGTGLQDKMYTMIFRFRLTKEAYVEDDHTFAQSKSVLEVGTKWKLVDGDNGKLSFFLILSTTEESEKRIESILHIESDEEKVCKDCVWSVFVKWDATEGREDADNIEITNLFRGEPTTTTHSIQGYIEKTKVAPLIIGVDKNHQIGRTRFRFGSFFAQEDENKILKEESLA